MPLSGYTTNKNLAKIAAGSTDNWDVWLNGDLDILDEPSIMYQVSAAENIAAGEVAVIKDDGTGAKRAYLATSANYTFGDPVGMASESVTAPAPVRLVLAGRVSDNGYSFGIADAFCYLSSTGTVTTTATNTKLGFVLSATSFYVIPTGVGKTDSVVGANGAVNTGDNVAAVIEPVYGASSNTVAEGNHAHTFPALTDSPSSYAGAAGKAVVVSAGSTALEFALPAGVGAYSGLVAKTNETNPNYQADISADAITLASASGGLLQAMSVTVTANILTTGVNGRDEAVAEKTSEHYALFVIGKPDGTIASLLKQWSESGATTSTTASKLVDSGASFLTDGLVSIGDIVVNQTSGASTSVSAIDSDTTLSLASDIFATSEDYQIVLEREPTMPTGYTYSRRVGSVFNTTSGHFRKFFQAGGKVIFPVWANVRYLSGGTSSSYTNVNPVIPPLTRVISVRARVDATARFDLSDDGVNYYQSVEGHTGTRSHIDIFLNSARQHYYKRYSGTGGLTLDLYGYEDNL